MRIIFILLFCGIALGSIDKVDEVSLPYWEQNILSNDPNETNLYIRALVNELEVILDKIRDAVNHGIDLNNPSTRYFASPDADGDYADGTWRMIAVDEDTFEIQKKIDGTWTEIATWTEDNFTFTSTDITISGTLTAGNVTTAGTVTAGTVTAGTVTTDSIVATDSTFVTITLSGNEINIATSQTPVGSTAPGTKGDIAWDSSYIYVAVDTNKWKRAALSAWGQEQVIYAGEDVIYAGEDVVYP